MYYSGEDDILTVRLEGENAEKKSEPKIEAELIYSSSSSSVNAQRFCVCGTTKNQYDKLKSRKRTTVSFGGEYGSLDIKQFLSFK